MPKDARKPFIFRWTKYAAQFVGPFADSKSAVRWARSKKHNPGDNPCWQTIYLTPTSKPVMVPVLAPDAAAPMPGKHETETLG